MKNKSIISVLIALSLLSFSPFFFGKKHRALLITGCARSGTKYVSSALTASGIEIGHEQMKSSGVAKWDLAANPKEARNKKWINLHNFQFDHIFHQVRDPLKVISSVYVTEDRQSWNYILKHTPEISIRDSHLTKCAKYWYYWNLKAEQLAEWTYRLEDLDQLWEEYGLRLGKPINTQAINAISKKTNTAGDPKRFTWDDLKKELDPELYHNIRKLAQKYGYL